MEGHLTYETVSAITENMGSRAEQHNRRRQIWRQELRDYEIKQRERRIQYELRRKQEREQIDQEYERIRLNLRRRLQEIDARFQSLHNSTNNQLLFSADAAPLVDTEDTVNDDNVCYICKEDPDSNRSIKKCGHCEGYVHVECIKEWHQYSGNSNCGYCGQAVKY